MGGLVLRTEPVGRALESVVSDRNLFPTPVFYTTYLDSEIRISRDQDGKLFVYSRVSNSTTPTSYEDAAADLGIPKLLEGAVRTIFRWAWQQWVPAMLGHVVEHRCPANFPQAFA